MTECHSYNLLRQNSLNYIHRNEAEKLMNKQEKLRNLCAERYIENLKVPTAQRTDSVTNL